MIVGIDASRIRSGGGVAHMEGILSAADPRVSGVVKVHVWANEALRSRLPKREWLEVHSPTLLKGGIFMQLWWQWTCLRRCARVHGCDVIFAADASTLFSGRKLVVMHQDMLAFDRDISRAYGWGIRRLRLWLIRRVQVAAMRRASGVVFLTQFARDALRPFVGCNNVTEVIPHGVPNEFWGAGRGRPMGCRGYIRCIYVSNIAPYKCHIEVVEAVRLVRGWGMDVRLVLVGGGSGRSMRSLERSIQSAGFGDGVVERHGFLSRGDVVRLYAESDVVLFASACETMPVTLIEAMATGLPIVCSDRGPMPEVLGKGGVYCDPRRPESIAKSLERIISDQSARAECVEVARELASKYSWERCARETWEFLARVERS